MEKRERTVVGGVKLGCGESNRIKQHSSKRPCCDRNIGVWCGGEEESSDSC